MRVTIVTDDDMVLVNGVPCPVDCSALRNSVHAVQWYDTYGEEEYYTTFDPETKLYGRAPNATITDFTPYQIYVDAWQVERTKQLEHEAELAKTNARMAALYRLPLHVRKPIIDEQIKKAEEEAKAADYLLNEAWKKLSPAEQQRLLCEARGETP